MDGVVRPLNMNKPVANEELLTPVSPTAPANYSRPSSGVPAGISPSDPNVGTTTTATSEPPHHQGKRESLFNTMKGLHGAGEALRGTVNGTIAKGMRDSAEEERMRAVRERGTAEWKGSGLSERTSGLREGFREKAGERMRTRRLSQDRTVHGSEGPNGLGVVEERDR